MVALSCSFDAVLEEVGSQLGALLLVAVGVGAVSVGVAIRSLLELNDGCRGLGWGQHWDVHVVAAIVGLLSTASGSPGALGGRGPTPSICGASSSCASEVLVRKLMGEAGIDFVARRIRPRLVGTVLAAGEVVCTGLRRVLRRVLALGEVALLRLWCLLRSITTAAASIGLSLGLKVAGLLLLAPGRGEDGLWERRRRGGKCPIVGGEPVVGVGKVEVQTVVVGHDGVVESLPTVWGRV